MVYQRHPFVVKLTGLLFVHVYCMEGIVCRGAVCIVALSTSLPLDESVEDSAFKQGESSKYRELKVAVQLNGLLLI